MGLMARYVAVENNGELSVRMPSGPSEDVEASPRSVTDVQSGVA